MNLSDAAVDVAEFDRYLTNSFDRGQASLRMSCRAVSGEESLSAARAVAWDLLRDVFAAWYHFERDVVRKVTPAELVAIRESVRLRDRFGLFRHANFPDASRLIAKDFPDPARLERADERNPGAPPSLDAVYRRQPAARGNYPPAERTFIEVLDHAVMRLQDLDVVHQRTLAAVRVLVPRIVDKLSCGEGFALLDVACGGNQLARHLSDALAARGVSGAERARVRILGVDVDPRAIPYTYASSGLGWHDAARGLAVDVVLGNLFEPATRSGIASWLSKNAAQGFDAVAALGIFDYIGCPVPGENRVYIPERFAPEFGNALRAYVSPGGVFVGAVFAEEGHDRISTGARHLLANWHIEHASASRMRGRFPFLKQSDFRPMTAAADPQLDGAVHFIVHEV